MAACPQCQRPVAVARTQCLYCGAALDPAIVPVRSAVHAPPPPPLEDRALVLIDATGCEAERVARVLGLALVEAEQRLRRGWQLHRIASPVEAEAEAERLKGEGLNAVALPDAEVLSASRPCRAEGGRRTADAIELRTDRGAARVTAGGLRLVVAGRIHRERQSVELRKRQLPPSLFPGYRFHLHLRDDATPIEIDPDAFAFDEALAVPAASLVELRAWLEGLQATIDDGFRFVPPALGVAAPADDTLSRALPARRRPDPDAPAILDNLAQFRFYSGWRAALERRVRG